MACNLNLEVKEFFDGKIEFDESCFGGFGKGKRNRGVGGKTAMFELLEHSGKFIRLLLRMPRQRHLLIPIIINKEKPDSIVYIDS